MSQTEAEEPKPAGYRLTITLAGPHHTEKIVLEEDSPAGLSPSYARVNDVLYERYMGDSAVEWIEFRFDHVITRELVALYEVVEEPDVDMPTDEELMAMPAEERIKFTKQKEMT